MKVLIGIISTLLFIGCFNQDTTQSTNPTKEEIVLNRDRVKPLNYKEKEIILAKTKYEPRDLAKINLFIPIEFDTLLTWYDASDCDCCGTYKYRLINSKDCLIKESGFFKSEYCTDNIDRLTIEYQCIGSTHNEEIDSISFNRFAEWLEPDYQNAYFFWHRKNIELINGNKFMVFDFTGPDKQSYSSEILNQLVAITISKRTWIRFRFECNKGDCADFSKKSYQILSSIKIDSL